MFIPQSKVASWVLCCFLVLTLVLWSGYLRADAAVEGRNEKTNMDLPFCQVYPISACSRGQAALLFKWMCFSSALSISKAGCIQQHCLSMWSILSSTCCPELPQQIISCKLMWNILWDYRGGDLLQHVVCPPLLHPTGQRRGRYQMEKQLSYNHKQGMWQKQDSGLQKTDFQCLDSLSVLWAPQRWDVVMNQKSQHWHRHIF